jgi:carbamate kinase
MIRLLTGSGAIVVCAGGGGIPVTDDGSGRLRGIEGVVDKDLTAALLARAVDADALLLLTDVEAVQDGYGTPQARPLHAVTSRELRARTSAASWRRPAAWPPSAASATPRRC